MTRSDLERLHDAREHAAAALGRLEKLWTGAKRDEADLFLAFLFNLSVVGTTMGKVSKAVQALDPEIPWRDVVDTRNRIVHAYWQADLEILNAVTAERLVWLLAALDGIIGLVERDAP